MTGAYVGNICVYFLELPFLSKSVVKIVFYFLDLPKIKLRVPL